MDNRSELVVGRRWFVTRSCRGVLGVAVLGLAACGDASGGQADPAASAPGTGTAGGGAGTGGSDVGSAEQLSWSRVDLGFVAAYVLVRGREAAVVDTGVEGSAGAIAAVLDEAGPGWAGVRHVVLTHKHPDHAGSTGDVLTEASGATGYVGTADLPEVDAPRPLTPVADGDEVFGLQLVGTPGHTAGHIAVFDADTGVLVAGDALSTGDGLAGSNPQFTEDEAAAAESVRRLARLAPSAILVGHGPPVLERAAAALDELAASLA